MRFDRAVPVLVLALAGCASGSATPKAPEPAAMRAPALEPAPAPEHPAAQSTPPRATPPPSPPPPLRPELSTREEERLIEEATRKIGDVERIFRQLEGRPLKPPQREVLLTAKNLLAQAKSALGARDYHRAANLASKAQTLSDDLEAATK